MNTTFNIKPHSMVDLITNSSTTIYTYNPDKELVKKIFDAVITASGSSKKADDLFTFQTVPDTGVMVDKLQDDLFGGGTNYLEIEDQVKYVTSIKDKLPPTLRKSIPDNPGDEEQINHFKSVWNDYYEDSSYGKAHEICTLICDELIRCNDYEALYVGADGNEYLRIELKPEYKDTLSAKQLEALNSLHNIFDTQEGYN